MDNQQQNFKEKRQRIFFLALPVVVYPFITLLLWGLGILGGKPALALDKPVKTGINTDLPGAQNQEKPWSKLAFYEQAAKDSARALEMAQNDPYSSGLTMAEKDTLKTASIQSGDLKFTYDPSPVRVSKAEGSASQLYEKINRLNSQMQTPPKAPEPQKNVAASSSPNAALPSTDLDRLENLMKAMDDGKQEDDPEMKQLNGMLERILDIQHPKRVQDRLKETSAANRGQVFPVSFQQQEIVTVLEGKQLTTVDTPTRIDSLRFAVTTGIRKNGFFSLEDNDELGNVTQAISAIVPETQTVVSGAGVKLRLLQDVYINGIKIPVGHSVYGIAQLNGERLQISIKSIGFAGTVFPVSLTVYDNTDAMEGLYTPGAISREVMKQSTDQTIQNIGISSLDPSLGAQAASAGVEAAKSLFSKKIKLVQVTVRGGHKALLKDDNNQL